MNKRLLIGFLTCLLLSGFAKMPTAYSCPPPQCPECQHWVPGLGCIYTCGCYPSPTSFNVWPSTNNRYVCIDDTIVFNAQWPLTYDGDGCSLIYIWNFGPGAYNIDLGVDGSYVSCRYGSPGNRTVTLTVTRVTSSDPNSCCHTPRTASFSRTVTVVKVASLLPDVGTEIDDGDGDPDTRSFAVCVCPGVVTVTATPDPNVPEQCLPGYGYTWGWTLTGGIGTSRLTRTVDRTTPGVTTITCVCGSSFKQTKIYVVKVEIIELGFKSDHMITEWPSGIKIDDPDGYTPVWKRTSNPDDPVCYTKNTPPTMFAVFNVTPSVVRLTLLYIWLSSPRCFRPMHSR